MSLLAHPVVVKHLREIFIAAVAGEGHHALRRGLRWQYFSAAASSVPLEEPARMPSVFSSSRAVVKASRSVMRRPDSPLQCGPAEEQSLRQFPQPAGARVVVASGFHGRRERIRPGQRDKFRMRRVLGEPRLQAAQRAA